MTESPVRVLIVDDQTLMREGLASLLEIQDGIAVVGTAGDGAEAVAQALALAPDVVLMDVRMPGVDGVVATGQLRERLPACRVLMLTTFDDDEYVAEALRAGASGYLLKDIPAGDLARAIQAVHAGVYQLAPSVAGKLLAGLSMAPAPPAPDPPPPAVPAGVELTAREREVLRLIAQGATNREIAAALVVSEGTVKNHISSILSRLGLRDRTQAAIYAHAHGLS